MADLKICSVEGCGKPASRRDLCNAHRLRLQRRGTTDIDPNWVRGRHCRGTRGQCPAAKKLAAMLDYARNSEKIKARAAARYAQKRDEINAALRAREDLKPASRERTKKWSAENRERKRANDKKFYNANRGLVNSYKAKRRALVLRATPPWLTPEMIADIRAKYVESERLTRETGIPHQVDHIVPLQGRTVCGLHLAINMRVIHAIQNNRRARIWSPEDDPVLGSP